MQCFTLDADSPDGSGDNVEQLELFFARYDVTISAKNLPGLLNAINATSLAEIRETLRTYWDAAVSAWVGFDCRVAAMAFRRAKASLPDTG